MALSGSVRGRARLAARQVELHLVDAMGYLYARNRDGCMSAQLKPSHPLAVPLARPMSVFIDSVGAAAGPHCVMAVERQA